MKKARLLVVMLLAVVMCFAFTACGGGDSEESGDAIVLKVAVQQNQDHETAKAVARIAEKVEAETKKVEKKVSKETEDLSKLTVAELRELAKEKEVEEKINRVFINFDLQSNTLFR